jgi:cell division protein FtsB
MQQRRTPGGHGPGARGGRDVRSAGRRAGSGARATTRDPGVRAEPTRGARSSPRGTTRAGTEPTRSANRPVVGRRAAVGATTTRLRAPQPRRITGRATIFCMLLIGLLLAYAYPVRVYLAQQAEIDTLERSQAAQRAHVTDLAGELEKWKDDEYVKVQARERLLLTPKGERPLLVIDPQAAAGAQNAGPGGQVAGAKGPWYGKLWSSIRTADQGTP